MSETTEEIRTRLTADQVADYLKKHPFFFCERDDLLMYLKIPHQRGSAISLVERQVALLRERNLEMRQRLNHLLSVARDNDSLLEKTRHLLLHLFEARSLNQVYDAVDKSLLHDFKVDYVSLILISETPLVTRGRIESLHNVQKSMGNLVDNRRAICGHLRKHEMAFLFPDKQDQVGSSAVIPINYRSPQGLLAVGSRDPDHFRSTMGSMFLNHIADALGRVLFNLMPK